MTIPRTPSCAVARARGVQEDGSVMRVRARHAGAGGSGEPHITALLQRWKDGDREALEQIVEASYGDLRRLAARHFRGRAGNRTLQPTALVNEALRRMIGQDEVLWANRVQFFAY